MSKMARTPPFDPEGIKLPDIAAVREAAVREEALAAARELLSDGLRTGISFFPYSEAAIGCTARLNATACGYLPMTKAQVLIIGAGPTGLVLVL